MNGEGTGMNDQQYTAQAVQEPEQVSSKTATEIANMDETDWMAMLVEMRILCA